jgi:hypothetical protein
MAGRGSGEGSPQGELLAARTILCFELADSRLVGRLAAAMPETHTNAYRF